MKTPRMSKRKWREFYSEVLAEYKQLIHSPYMCSIEMFKKAYDTPLLHAKIVEHVFIVGMRDDLHPWAMMTPVSPLFRSSSREIRFDFLEKAIELFRDKRRKLSTEQANNESTRNTTEEKGSSL